MISWLRYVRHADIPAFEAKGWRVSGPLPFPHSRWSVLMIWAGEGAP